MYFSADALHEKSASIVAFTSFSHFSFLWKRLIALATASFLASQKPGCTAYVIGEAGLTNALYDKDIYMNDVNPDYVVLGETRTYCFEKLEKAIGLLDQAIGEVEASDLPREQKDTYIQRLEVIKLQPRYMYLYNYMQYETDETQMKIEVRQFIRDAMSHGAVWCREGCKFDLDNLIFY